MNDATVTVVIATYGEDSWRELARGRALPSVLGQTSAASEVLLEHFPDGTLAEARNLASKAARGAWLCFLDADDELEPRYLEEMRSAERRKLLHEPRTLARVEDGLLAPAMRRVDEAGTSHPATLPNRHEPINVLNHCAIGTLIPAALFRQLGGFSGEYPIYEDWALFLAASRAGAKIVDVPGAVYRWHERRGSRNHAADRAVYDRIRSEHIACASS